jgi:hypothetical protein
LLPDVSASLGCSSTVHQEDENAEIVGQDLVAEPPVSDPNPERLQAREAHRIDRTGVVGQREKQNVDALLDRGQELRKLPRGANWGSVPGFWR